MVGGWIGIGIGRKGGREQIAIGRGQKKPETVVRKEWILGWEWRQNVQLDFMHGVCGVCKEKAEFKQARSWMVFITHGNHHLFLNFPCLMI